MFSDICCLSLPAGISALAMCMIDQFSGLCQYVKSAGRGSL